MKLFAGFLINSALGIECERQTTTKNGRTCQQWDTTFPHQPNKQMVDYIMETTGNVSHNHCVRADPQDPLPFCYTTDPNVRFEHCICEDQPNYSDSSSDYNIDYNSDYSSNNYQNNNDYQTRGFGAGGYGGNNGGYNNGGYNNGGYNNGGNYGGYDPRAFGGRQGQNRQQRFCTVSKTIQGYTCQNWSSSWPHQPNYRMIQHRRQYLGDNMNHNYCRAADPSDPKPWCYTTDPSKKYDYCNCSGGQNPVRPPTYPVRPPNRQPRRIGPPVCEPDAGTITRKFTFKYDKYDSQGSILSSQAQSHNSDGNRIFGGVDSLPGEVPWQVNLLIDGDQLSNLQCGGTLVSASKIISAAHCFKGEARLARRWTVIAGHINMGSYNLVQRRLSKLQIHPNYKGQKAFDLAVLIVDQPFTINDFIRPACLPAVGFAGNIRGGDMVISGMGKTPTSSAQSPNMKIATIPMKSKAECKRNPNMGAPFKGRVMICGGEHNKDTCQGDSGGPLIANVDGKFTLVGVTSWGKGCGGVNSPGVYADISHPSMMKFIKQVN